MEAVDAVAYSSNLEQIWYSNGCNQGVYGCSGQKWWNSVDIIKFDQTGFADRKHVIYERKRGVCDIKDKLILEETTLKTDWAQNKTLNYIKQTLRELLGVMNKPTNSNFNTSLRNSQN